MFYINFKGEIYVKDVQRTDNLSSVHFSFANLTQLYYGITENTVVNYVFSLFPKFQLHLGYTINSYLDFNANGVELQYYKFIFDSQIVVVVEVQGLDLSLFSYEEPDNIDDLSTGFPFGGFLPLADLQDTLYLEVYQHVLGSYQMLATKTVQSVRYQLVQGTNFMIEFSNYPFSHSVYVVMAFKSLDSSIPPSVTSISKNGVDISNTIVNDLTLPGAFNY